ncbi:MAG TPA: DUF3536 domain-containing protein [Thermosynergistes sp.]|nr:DUF3536 domain-containing protein [Thermosynergistes sp.]
MERYVCIHGHFYQPPRENPWLEEVELEESAHPYHDWNERITAECYAPNTASRILGSDRRIVAIVNNYAKISFNVGPTLFSWMKKHAPETYEAIRAADEEARARFSGHGSAIAQAYNHMIMPLAVERDVRTQVLWGIRDFEDAFSRKPEGMWLPETAVDVKTLEALADCGIKFTILAPHQAVRCRKIGEAEWRDVSGGKIDPKRPYLCKLPSGKTIAIFFYDGPISSDIAFGGLLNNGEAMAGRLAGAFSDKQDEVQLVHIATDGESYGHHHRFGDMALAYCLDYLESKGLAKVTVYGEYLEKYPPTHEVEIVEGSSWSCIHGVGRWKENCGCNSGLHPGWQQEWRKPLREAADWLRDELAAIYEDQGKGLFLDPWRARDEYIRVILDRSKENVVSFLAEQAGRELSDAETVKALKLLEMERHAMLMYTSCGWFFDEISGIESVQVMKYASRAMQLAACVSGASLEDGYLSILEKAPSNIKEVGNGRNAYERFVRPSQVDMLRVGAHFAISSLFEEEPEDVDVYCYTVQCDCLDKVKAGKLTLGTGRALFTSNVTFDEKKVAFAALHMGDQNVLGGLREQAGNGEFDALTAKMKEALGVGDVSLLVRLMDDYFGDHNYTLKHLFKDQQRKVLDRILGGSLDDIINVAFRRILEENYTVMNFLKEMGIAFPKPLEAVAEVVLNVDILRLLGEEAPDLEALRRTVEDVKRWDVPLDEGAVGLAASRCADALLLKLKEEPFDVELLEEIDGTLQLLDELSLSIYPWKAQNVYFLLTKEVYPTAKDHLSGEEADRWVELFKRVGGHLKVQVA